jgi:Protein of unknown function (DUF1579)
MRIFVSSLAAFGLLVASAISQEPKKDAQASFEPRSRPGAGQKYLETMAGDWDVVKKFHPRNGAPNVSKGTCRQTMIHAGRFLQSDFVFGEGNARTTGMGIIGFEPESSVFTSFWTDSRQTKMSVRQSKDLFDGKAIVLHSKSLDATGKETRRSKTISRVEDDGNRVVHQQFALGADGEERLMMELLMTRRPPEPPAKAP